MSEPKHKASWLGLVVYAGILAIWVICILQSTGWVRSFFFWFLMVYPALMLLALVLGIVSMRVDASRCRGKRED